MGTLLNIVIYRLALTVPLQHFLESFILKCFEHSTMYFLAFSIILMINHGSESGGIKSSKWHFFSSLLINIKTHKSDLALKTITIVYKHSLSLACARAHTHTHTWSDRKLKCSTDCTTYAKFQQCHLGPATDMAKVTYSMWILWPVYPSMILRTCVHLIIIFHCTISHFEPEVHLWFLNNLYSQMCAPL
jgi:hypothetical protein